MGTNFQKIKEDVQVTDFIQVVGTDLLGAKVISAADFSTPPNPLQLAKLTRRIRESGIHITDIEVGQEWKDKQDEWWEEHGALFVERLQDKWKSRAAGGGALTDKMLEGKYLSVPEASYVVQHKDFDLLMRKLGARPALTHFVCETARRDSRNGQRGAAAVTERSAAAIERNVYITVCGQLLAFVQLD